MTKFLKPCKGFDSSAETGDWGEPDPLIDFSLEEILDMPTMGEVQSDPTLEKNFTRVTDSDLQGEGIKTDSIGIEGGRTETFGTSNSDRAKLHRDNSLNLANFTANLPQSPRDDLELIDIDSLFDDESSDKPVLSKDEAWELFS